MIRASRSSSTQQHPDTRRTTTAFRPTYGPLSLMTISSSTSMMTAMITRQSLMISNRQYHSPLRRQRHSSRRHSPRRPSRRSPSRRSPQTATA